MSAVAAPKVVGRDLAALHIQGMHCAKEVSLLRTELGRQEGISNLSFDIVRSRMEVEFDPQKLKIAEIAGTVARLGMKAELWRETGTNKSSFWERHGRLILAAISGFLLLAGLFLQIRKSGSFWHVLADSHFSASPLSPLTLCLFLGSVIAGSWYSLPKIALAVRKFRPDMNLLVGISISGACLLGEWSEGATVAFLFAVANLIESWNVVRARKAITTLLHLAPNEATILRDGSELRLPVEHVPVGSTVLVRPGEKIPLDGIVSGGSSRVNQAPITGESCAVGKMPGDSVYAGTLNEEGALEIQTSRAAKDTTFSRIVQLVEHSATQRAPAERWVEQFARYYTPIMIALTVAIWVGPPVLFGNWTEWFYRGLVVLVIACPCALVISTPVSIVAALTSAARQGVLIKGGAYLEVAARLRVVAFDKTGVLTLGEPRVQSVIPVNGHSEQEVLAPMAALEARSEHPLAKAIGIYVKSKGIVPAPVSHFKALPGKGVEARIAGQPFWIGSHRLLLEKRIETPEIDGHVLRLQQSGHTVVICGDQQQVWALVTIADGIRPSVRETVSSMRREGVERIVVLTGDNEVSARNLGANIGADQVEADVLPEEKVLAIEELKKSHKFVAMVGDGVNDVPAMASATVGIALGATGTDAALETASIVLMSGDISKLPFLLRHSRRTLHIIKQNVAFALGAKILFLGLASLGLATLWMAIAADMGATFVVTLNGLRLLRSPASSD